MKVLSCSRNRLPGAPAHPPKELFDGSQYGGISRNSARQAALQVVAPRSPVAPRGGASTSDPFDGGGQSCPRTRARDAVIRPRRRVSVRVRGIVRSTFSGRQDETERSNA